MGYNHWLLFLYLPFNLTDLNKYKFIKLNNKNIFKISYFNI